MLKAIFQSAPPLFSARQEQMEGRIGLLQLHRDVDDESDSSLLATTPDGFWNSIYTVGLELLTANRQAWGAVSHGGFRPFNSLGVEQAKRCWKDFHDSAKRRWCRSQCLLPTHLFPQDGLGTKVALDRTMEVLHQLDILEPSQFIHRYHVVPIVPRCGGAARCLSLLQGRSMLLGSDHCVIRHQPQELYRVTKTLNRELRTIAQRLQQEEIVLQWTTAENCLCCFSKVLDNILEVGQHAPY